MRDIQIYVFAFDIQLGLAHHIFTVVVHLMSFYWPYKYFASPELC